MKTNSIQNSNTSFGMALKINPKLKPQLLSAHSATIERLQKIGKEAENVKLYDVCYEKDIYIPSVRSVVNKDGKDYFAEMKRQEQLLGKPYTLTYGDETYQEAYNALKAGEADGIVADDTILLGFSTNDKSVKILPKRYSKEPYAVVFRKDEASSNFNSKVDYIIENLQSSGKLNRLQEKWKIK
jgi:hypothetical protein